MSWHRLQDWFGQLRSKRTRAEQSLLRDERGATYVEYITLVVLIAVASMGAWYLWQQAVKRDAQGQYTTFGTPPDE